MGDKLGSITVSWGAWLLFCGLRWYLYGVTLTSVVAAFVMFAVLVLVPLVFELVRREDTWFTLARWLHRWAAAAAALSLLTPQGWEAAFLAAPWLVVTGLLALSGLADLAYGGRRLLPSEQLINAALIYVPVGGGWLLLHRTGMPALGFTEIIMLLTAVHFHYAAFTAPVIAAFVGERLDRPSIHEWAAAGIIVSPALIAAGLTFSPLLNMGGVALFPVSLFLLAGLILWRLVLQIDSGRPRLLLATAGASIAAGMVLALLYVFGPHVALLPAPGIPEMAVSHGVINGFGFSLCGLLGLKTLRR